MKRFYLFLLTIFPWMFACEEASASHIAGGDISYVGIPGAPNQFVVTVKLYRDCSGGPYENPITINWVSPSGCGVSGSAQLNLVPGTGPGNEIQSGMYPPCTISSCNGGTGYGIEEYVYSDLIDLGDACNDWRISYSSCCRNINVSPAINSISLETKLNNLYYPFDNSPVPNPPPVFTLCVGRTHQLDLSCIDPDGDSLIYILTNAMVYNPLPAIDPQTGIITFAPVFLQVGALHVRVESYSRTTGQQIGTINRDVQVNVEAVCNDPPHFDSTHVLLDNLTASCNDSILHMKLSWPFQCTTLASDGSDFRLLSPNGIPLLIGSALAHNCNCQGMSDSIEIFINGTLSTNGIYKLLTKIGYDGNTLLTECGVAVPEFDTCFFSFNNCWVGIDELDGLNSLVVIVPNPADQYLIIKTEMNGKKRFRVMNASGQLIMAFDSVDHETRVDLASLPEGSYCLEMQSEKGSERSSFVIIH